MVDAIYGEQDHYSIETQVKYHDGRVGMIKADIQVRTV